MRDLLKIKASLILSVFSCVFILSVAQAESIPSKVDQVTLFSNQAQIVRVATTTLKAGSNTVELAGVPENLNAESLQVRGRGEAPVSIVGVEYRKRFLEHDVSEELRALEDKIEAQTKELTQLNTNRVRLENERQQVEKISLSQPEPESSGRVLQPATAKEMGEILNFKSEAGAKIDQQLFLVADQIKTVQKQLEVLKRQAAELKPGRRAESIVEVVLNAKRDTAIELELSYQVAQASWRPAYHLNVGESAKEINFNLDTYGVITQSTGEDWQDIKLVLSTARPHLGLDRPEPHPYYLDVTKPVNAGVAASGRMRMLKQDQMSMPMMEEGNAALPAEPLKEEIAQIAEGVVVTFEVAGRVDIKGGGSTEKIKVTNGQLGGELTFVAAPALSQQVFREALLTNSTTYPLMAGPVNIFSNGNFVGRNHISHTPRDQEFRLPVGVSEDLLIERKLLRRFEEDSGIIKSHRKIQFDYEIEVKNLAEKERMLILLEPTFVSRNEKITVKLTDQKPTPLRADAAERIQPDPGIIEWHLKSAPKSKSKVSYTVTVEFSADLPIEGL